MKLSFRTSQHYSPGHTSLLLDIAYTNGALNEEQISSAYQLATDAFIHSISQSIIRSSSSRQTKRPRQLSEEAQERNQMDEIIEQILRQSTHLSAV